MQISKFFPLLQSGDSLKMSNPNGTPLRLWQRSRALLVVFVASAGMLFAQERSEKFSMTTQMFLDGLGAQPAETARSPRRATAQLQRAEGLPMRKARRLIASPDTIDGTAYISCFIHLKDVNDLDQVRSLGVELEETFDGQDFVTARVPVGQLEKLADIDNVSKIKVARQMRLLTDVARQKTNVDDVLTQSDAAVGAGITGMFDGTGVVLGIIDTGIDFQHVAFKDKDGNSRIRQAYVYNGSSAREYTTITSSSPTTDDSTEDHGTHTSTTAGGSSVIVSGTTVTVTDDHANATYGGMAPGADLYLAGINGLSDTYLTNALKKMVVYADSQGKPLVVSNSWGSGWGPRDGTGEFADLVAQYFGDSHPGHIILFASSNDAGHQTGTEGGGFFVRKDDATSGSPLGTIIRTDQYGGDYYYGLMACAWNAGNSTKLNCKIHVLSSTGALKKTWTVTSSQTSFSGLSTYYSGSLAVYIEQENGRYQVAAYSENGLQSRGSYTLAIEVYPASGSADINMWAGDWSYFTGHLTTSGYTWTDGTDDMCVSDEATIPDAISVGAYVSKKQWKASNGSTYSSSVYTPDDIAYFSSYATAELSPTGEAYPWITAPGARLAAGVNHYHTSSVDYEYSYYGAYSTDLVVNNSKYPYGMMEGTSMATPVAAGIVALWLQAAQSVGKELTVNDVKDIMEATAINDSYTTTGTNASHFGKGKIDALAGIQYILNTQSVPSIMASATSISFDDVNPYATRTYTKTLNVKGLNLEGDITLTLSDANGVYSLSQTSIAQDAAADGADIIITYAPQSAGTHEATIILSGGNATDIAVSLTATARPATPTIIAEPETLNFTASPDEARTMTFDVLSEFLTEDVTVALEDADNVFSAGRTNISKAESENGASVAVTFLSATEGTFSGTVTLGSVGAESVLVTLTGTALNVTEETIDFTTQGYANAEAVEGVSGSNCTVSFSKGTGSNSPKYYDTGEAIRLYGGNTMTVASTGKSIAGIELTFGSGDGSNAVSTDHASYSNGTWTGRASSVTFTIGGQTGHRRVQKVKVTYADGPADRQDVAMAFTPAAATAIIGEDFAEPALATTPVGLPVTYSSSEADVATVDPATGEVTPLAVGTATITASFAGDDGYNEGSASYELTVVAASAPGGQTLMYEGLSGYSKTTDSSQELRTSSNYLDWGSWQSITKVYAGGTDNAYESGGCLKFGSGMAKGAMETGPLPLVGRGRLTFRLKQYGSDTGKLNVTVTGATADVTQFTPQGSWTLCTVNLANATGTVTIKLETSSRRAYVDEITLTAAAVLVLAGDADNTEAIGIAHGGRYDVTLQNYALTGGGYWNAICLPFDVTIADSPLAGADVRSLRSASLEDETLTLDFSAKGEVTAVTAGTPYIIRWTDDADIVNPVFEDVTVSAPADDFISTDGKVYFTGTYNPVYFEEEDRSILFVGNDHTFCYPTVGQSIGALRSYFQFPGGGTARLFILNIDDDDDATSTRHSSEAVDEKGLVIVNLAGQRVSERWTEGRPARGVYIVNGRVLVK